MRAIGIIVDRTSDEVGVYPLCVGDVRINAQGSKFITRRRVEKQAAPFHTQIHCGPAAGLQGRNTVLKLGHVVGPRQDRTIFIRAAVRVFDQTGRVPRAVARPEVEMAHPLQRKAIGLIQATIFRIRKNDAVRERMLFGQVEDTTDQRPGIHPVIVGHEGN